jgi:hypothetical protein
LSQDSLKERHSTLTCILVVTSRDNNWLQLKKIAGKDNVPREQKQRNIGVLLAAESALVDDECLTLIIQISQLLGVVRCCNDNLELRISENVLDSRPGLLRKLSQNLASHSDAVLDAREGVKPVICRTLRRTHLGSGNCPEVLQDVSPHHEVLQLGGASRALYAAVDRVIGLCFLILVVIFGMQQLVLQRRTGRHIYGLEQVSGLRIVFGQSVEFVN